MTVASCQTAAGQAFAMLGKAAVRADVTDLAITLSFALKLKADHPEKSGGLAPALGSKRLSLFSATPTGMHAHVYFLFEGEPVGARRSYWRAMKRGGIFANIASAAGWSVCG
jgi:hypothetical protein